MSVTSTNVPEEQVFKLVPQTPFIAAALLAVHVEESLPPFSPLQIQFTDDPALGNEGDVDAVPVVQ